MTVAQIQIWMHIHFGSISVFVGKMLLTCTGVSVKILRKNDFVKWFNILSKSMKTNIENSAVKNVF